MRDDDAIRLDAREAAMIESHRFRFGDLLVEHPAKRLERIVRNRFDVSLDAGVVEEDVHAAATSCSRLTSAPLRRRAVSRWRERVPRHRGRPRRCGRRRVRPRAGWLRFRFHRRRLSPGPPFRSAHDRSCRASPPQGWSRATRPAKALCWSPGPPFARERESNFSATFLSCLALRSRSRRNARRLLLILKLYGLLGSAVQSFPTLVPSLIAKRSKCRDVCLFVVHLASAGVCPVTLWKAAPHTCGAAGPGLQGERHCDSSRRKNGSSRTTNGLDPANGLA